MGTSPIALAAGARSPIDVRQLSLSTLVALHLIPGALMTVAFLALAPAVEAIGFPPIAGLLIAIVVVLVPFELGVLRWAAREQRVGLIEVVPYRRPLPRRDWLWIVPVLIGFAFLGFGLSMAIEPQLIARFFSWLPEWFVQPILLDHVGSYSAAAWLVTLAGYFAINGLIGPIVEELYFRGFLLPRMERLGRWAPLLNVSLFSLYHFWSPWQLAARILALGPMVYAVRWKRNVYLGMAVHCSLNSLGVLIVALTVIGRL
jgi:membrane protease YdiL (CAAX protease family)